MEKIVVSITLLIAGKLINSVDRIIATLYMLDKTIGIPKDMEFFSYIGIVCEVAGVVWLLLLITLRNNCLQIEKCLMYAIAGSGMILAGMIGICTTRLLRALYDVSEMIFLGKPILGVMYFALGVCCIFFHLIRNLKKQRV